ncbi:MAG: hypothetical protein ACYTEI_03870 [Planctomycetota bacterium]
MPCPLCGYDLRDLTEPRCPECRHDLVLTVGVTRPPLAWLLVTLAPSMFSGIAAGLLLIPMLMVPLIGGEAAPWPFVAAETFGLLSALAALLLIRKRHVFLELSQAAQRRWAVGAWALHVGAFVALVASLILLF